MTARERGHVGGEIEVGEFPWLRPTEGAGMEAGKSQRVHPPPVPETRGYSSKALCSHLPPPYLPPPSFTAIYIWTTDRFTAGIFKCAQGLPVFPFEVRFMPCI